jgi:tryptophanyl-tRNA synthetase
MVSQHLKDYEDKVKQFGLIPLLKDEERLNFFVDIVESLQRLGVWAMQNPTPIMEAIRKGRDFFVLVGFRPSRFHLGHVTLAQELAWYMSRGAKPLFIVSGYEAGSSLSASEAHIKVSEFWQILKVVQGHNIPEPDHVYSDKECLELRLLEDRVEECISAQKIFQLYGWKSDISVAALRVATMNAAAFLFSCHLFPDTPLVVLSDIMQITHAEVAKIVAHKIKVPVPAFSYRMLLSSLRGPQQRMSVKNESSAIFLDEDASKVSVKLRGCFSGGRMTIEEQREQGGNPFACSFFKVCRLLIPEDQAKEMLIGCVSGSVMCGNCKTQRIRQALMRFEQLSIRIKTT